MFTNPLGGGMGSTKRAIIALSVAPAGVLGAAGAVGYLTFVRSPQNAPAEVCGEAGVPGSGPVVVAGGREHDPGRAGRGPGRRAA